MIEHRALLQSSNGFSLLVAVLLIFTYGHLSASGSYQAVVDSAELVELAETFSEDKIDKLVGDVSGDAAFALLVGLGLVEPDQYIPTLSKAKESAFVEILTADPVFMASARAESFSFEEDSDFKSLEGLLFEALALNLTTGYNITRSSDWPNYAPDRMIIYGHNDLKHLRQLLFLLRTEGLKPNFQFLNKRSAFKIREGWGVANEETPRLADGTPVAQIAEYELFLEFEDRDQVLTFQNLVTQYAKKDSDEETGLIYRSWWQPFYRSLVPSGELVETREIWVSVGAYKANVLSIPIEAPGKLKGLNELSNQWTIKDIPLWVNPSFYRYLQGDFK